MAGESIQTELKTFRRMQEELKEHHNGKFVLIHGEVFIDAFDTFDRAAVVAVDRFGQGPYLIRRVDDGQPIPMPASVAFQPLNADN